MKHVRLKCPRCGRSQRLRAEDAGLAVVCPACGQQFAFPASWSPAEPSEETFAPTPVSQPARAGGPPVASGTVIGLGIAAGTLAGIAVVIVVLSLRPPAAVVAPPAPATFPPAPVSVVPPPVTPPSSGPAQRPPTTVAVAPPPPPEPATRPTFHGLVPVRPKGLAGSSDTVLDVQIGKAIDRATDYLISHFKDGLLLPADGGSNQLPGRDALAVYAMLQASRAVDRPDLAADSRLAGQMLTALATLDIGTSFPVYGRSLRASALGIYNRPRDRITLEADARWLEQTGRAGGYTYNPPIRTQLAAAAAEEAGDWDNSNSQYGALGVWAAEETGVSIPSAYWTAVRRHWARSQRTTGQWGYSDGFNPLGDARLSMTVAGLTMMLVAEDHLGVGSNTDGLGRSPYSPTVARGLAWLDAGDHAVELAGDWPAYTLYGLERAGLASGIKSFGVHDWYRELAAKQLLTQRDDGSWGDVVNTSFTLLFLSRGRHPILFEKLRFDGAWANRPRDVANLTLYASTALERQFNWQVVSADGPWQNWMDAPVLFLASHRPPPLSDDQVDKLRAYAENGGLVFTSSDGPSPSFDAAVADLARRLFPRYRYGELPATDPVYRSLFPLGSGTDRPRLMGVSNGSRLLLVHSPADLGRSWQVHATPGTRPRPFQVGLNVFIDAAGKANFRNRLRSVYLPEPAVTPVGTTGVARIRYGGNWDPEPAAAVRFTRAFLGETSIAVTLAEVDPAGLDVHATPVASLTGTDALKLSAPQARSLHDYVAAGGVLLIDACGGSKPFADSVTADLLPAAFPGLALADLPADHPIAAGTGPGMARVDPRLRNFAADLAGVRRQPLQYLSVGDGLVLFSPRDLTTGLLGTDAWGIDGYEPAAAYGWVRNALLWAVADPGRVTAAAATSP